MRGEGGPVGGGLKMCLLTLKFAIIKHGANRELNTNSHKRILTGLGFIQLRN